MGNIVHRLRDWRYLHLALGGELFEAAADEIERLQNSGACPHVRGAVTQHCSLNFTFTDAEREAMEFFAEIHSDDDPPHEYAVILGKLLERMK